MSWIGIVTQVLLPVVLLAWMAVFPATGWLAWGGQLISVAAALLGVGLASLWAVPPFWVPEVQWASANAVNPFITPFNKNPGCHVRIFQQWIVGGFFEKLKPLDRSCYRIKTDAGQHTGNRVG